MKKLSLVALLLAVLLSLLGLPFVRAQERLEGVRLLAWGADGRAWLVSTPGQTITLADGARRQGRVLWRWPVGRSGPSRLAEGFDLVVSPDGQLIQFSRQGADGRAQGWQIEAASGALKPWSGRPITPTISRATGSPTGQAVLAPDGQGQIVVSNQFFQSRLWLLVAGEPPRLLLSRPGVVISDLAWRPDGQAVAFIQTPLGSGSEAQGELWRLDLAGGAGMPLSRNGVVDRSPRWSPDGARIAVVRDDEIVVVPADQLQVGPDHVGPDPAGPELFSAQPRFGPGQLTPPAFIRVIHHESNTCRQVPVGQIEAIPFEEYVKRVVPYEVYPSWPAEALKAQAVAARTYGWYFVNRDPGGDYHVTDWVDFQYMCDTTVAATDQAVDETRSEYLAYQDQPIVAFFSAENSSPTRDRPSLAYIRAVEDPVSFGQVRNGHGYGLGQWGAQRWAEQHGWSYQAILGHYYDGASLVEGAVISDTAPPNVALIRPWSDHYLTANQLWLTVNSSDDGGLISRTNLYLSTPTRTTRLFSHPGPARPGGYRLDLSTWPDQTLLSPSLVITAEAFDALGRRGVSPPLRFGLDRVPPSGYFNLAGSSLIFTGSLGLSLTLVASDTTAGVSQIALGNLDWQVEGEAFIPQSGGGSGGNPILADPAAHNGLALSLSQADQAAGLWLVERENWLPAGQPYRAYFRLKVTDTLITEAVVSLTAIDLQSGATIGLRRVRGIDFREPNRYQAFPLDFVDLDGGPARLAFQLDFHDRADLVFDRVIVLEYPTPYSPQPVFKYLNQRLRLIDGAGNVSPDFELFVQGTGLAERWLYLPLVWK